MATISTGRPIASIPIDATSCGRARGLLRWCAAVACDQAHLIALAGITAIGAFMRFYTLDRPTLWYDEAATYSRVNGGYYDLLEYLQFDGFPPIFYQLYWLLGQVVYLDGFYMRVIPATAGVLMIPAMYFLTRQLLSRRAALLAALLTMSSAWMMLHSRDAKMYMTTWLFIAMAMGCLFCWLRTDKRVAWLGWIFFALASVGTHASALILLAIVPFFVLTAPRLRWSRLAYLVLGMAVILSGPGGYYYFFNKWNQRTGGIFSGSVATQSRSGALAEAVVGTEVGDVDPSAAGEFGGGRAEFAGWDASGLTWVQRQIRNLSGPQVLRRSVSTYFTAWQWPSDQQIAATHRGGDFVIPRVVVYGVTTLLSILALAAAVALMPWPRRWAARLASRDDVPPPTDDATATDLLKARAEVGAHRAATWLALWMVLPTYGFYYCRSIEGFVAPWHWLEVIWGAWGWWWLALLGGALALAAGPMRWGPLRGLVALVAVVAAALPLKAAITAGGWYWLGAYTEKLLEPLTLGVLCVSIPAMWLYHAGPNWRDRGRRCFHALYAVGLVLGLCIVAYLFWTWMAQIAENKSNIAWLTNQTDKKNAYAWQPLWVPRYLGFVWPALAVATAWLILRLPGWPLRAAVVACFLAYNLGSAGSRVLLDTEPRLDRMIADIWDASDEPDTVRTFFFNGHGGNAWRNPGNLNSYPSSFYIAAYKQYRPTPQEMRGGWIYGERRGGNTVPNLIERRPPNINFRQLPEQLERTPDAQRLIIWTSYRAGPQPDMADNTTLEQTLGPQWKLVSDEYFRQRSHRTWEMRGWHRRREYVRTTNNDRMVELPVLILPGPG